MPFQKDNFEMQRKVMNEVEALRVHYKMDRFRVSQTVKDMVSFCQQRMGEDPLIYPVKENPFKEKKSCAIL